jgi:hypothetical protein
MDIRVRDTVFTRGNAQEVSIKNRGKQRYYYVSMFLEGKDLPYVKQVKYILHSTFRPQTYLAVRSHDNPNCTLNFWTWGIFTVKVLVEYKSGQIETIEHPLEYGNQLRSPSIRLIDTTFLPFA